MFKTTALDSVGNAYVDKNIGTSTPGTRLEADDSNIVQDELVNAVEGAGLTLDPGGFNRDQLLEAITRLGGLLTVEGDIVTRGASIPERLAAVVTGRVLKSAGIGVKPAWGEPKLIENHIAFGSSNRNAGGVQTISGVGFYPSLVILLSGDSAGGNMNWSIGFDDAASYYCLRMIANGTNISFSISKSVSIYRDVGNLLEGYISAFGGDGFDITWTLTGACALNFLYVVIG